MLSRLLAAPRAARSHAARSRTAALLAGLAVGAFCTPASAQWLQRGYDAAATYANTAETTLTPANVSWLGVLWRSHAPSSSSLHNSEAAESSGLIFDCNHPPLARARSSTTGKLVWQRKLDATYCDAPALGGGKVYMPLSNPGNIANTSGLLALDQATGAVLWQSTWPSGSVPAVQTNTAPALVGDTLYIADHVANLRAVDANTGTAKWQSQTAADSWNNSVVVADGRAFVTTSKPFGGQTAPGTYAFDVATGQLLWSRLEDLCSTIDHAPTVLDERVITPPCGTGPMTARRASDGKLLWRNAELKTRNIQPLVGHGDTLYNPQPDGLIAIDAGTGQVRWHRDDQDLSDGFLTNLAWANGMLFMTVDKAADAKLELRVLDAATGRRLTRRFRSYPQWARVFGNSLTVVDGRVQIGYYEDGQGDSTSQARWITYGLP